jgi:small subunit ribosomal protein S20
MPTSISAAKRLRQNKSRAGRNKRVKLNIAYILKQVRKSTEANDKAKAQELAKQYQKAVDKAVQHGVLHGNTAARRKSSLLAKVNALK